MYEARRSDDGAEGRLWTIIARVLVREAKKLSRAGDEIGEWPAFQRNRWTPSRLAQEDGDRSRPDSPCSWPGAAVIDTEVDFIQDMLHRHGAICAIACVPWSLAAERSGVSLTADSARLASCSSCAKVRRAMLEMLRAARRSTARRTWDRRCSDKRLDRDMHVCSMVAVGIAR